MSNDDDFDLKGVDLNGIDWGKVFGINDYIITPTPEKESVYIPDDNSSLFNIKYDNEREMMFEKSVNYMLINIEREFKTDYPELEFDIRKEEIRDYIHELLSIKYEFFDKIIHAISNTNASKYLFVLVNTMAGYDISNILNLINSYVRKYVYHYKCEDFLDFWYGIFMKAIVDCNRDIYNILGTDEMMEVYYKHLNDTSDDLDPVDLEMFIKYKLFNYTHNIISRILDYLIKRSDESKTCNDIISIIKGLCNANLFSTVNKSETSLRLLMSDEEISCVSSIPVMESLGMKKIDNFSRLVILVESVVDNSEIIKIIGSLQIQSEKLLEILHNNPLYIKVDDYEKWQLSLKKCSMSYIREELHNICDYIYTNPYINSITKKFIATQMFINLLCIITEVRDCATGLRDTVHLKEYGAILNEIYNDVSECYTPILREISFNIE